MPVNVTLFATPQNDATAVNVLALFAQDSYSVKRLTLLGGIRFEQLEGYLPSQSSPDSPFAAANIGGFAAQPRSYPEIRNIVKWNTAGPRVERDLRRDGRRQDGGEGLCRPLLLHPVDRRRRREQRQPQRKLQRAVHLERPQRRSCVPARGAVRRRRSSPPWSSTARWPPRSTRTSRALTPTSTGFALDRELMANTKLSVVYTYRREKLAQVTINPDNPVRHDAHQRGRSRDRRRGGTADDGTYGFFAGPRR